VGNLYIKEPFSSELVIFMCGERHQALIKELRSGTLHLKSLAIELEVNRAAIYRYLKQAQTPFKYLTWLGIGDGLENQNLVYATAKPFRSWMSVLVLESN